MNIMKKYNIFLIIILVTLLFAGCKYDFILPEEVPVINPDVPVSFATQIAPIFSNGDKCTSCHKTGGQTPDLSSANAYSQTVPAFVVLTSPETSMIYSFPAPTSTTHTWKKYTSSEAALILEWIKQGAKNN
jgi:hypothetical protein